MWEQQLQIITVLFSNLHFVSFSIFRLHFYVALFLTAANCENWKHKVWSVGCSGDCSKHHSSPCSGDGGQKSGDGIRGWNLFCYRRNCQLTNHQQQNAHCRNNYCKFAASYLFNFCGSRAFSVHLNVSLSACIYRIVENHKYRKI